MADIFKQGKPRKMPHCGLVPVHMPTGAEKCKVCEWSWTEQQGWVESGERELARLGGAGTTRSVWEYSFSHSIFVYFGRCQKARFLEWKNRRQTRKKKFFFLKDASKEDGREKEQQLPVLAVPGGVGCFLRLSFDLMPGL